MAEIKENVILENVRIAFRNFAGKEGKFNKEGDRNFAAILPEDVAQQMEKDGWNVKYLRPREEGDAPQAYIQVKVSYKGRPPRVHTITSRGKTSLGEKEVEILDWAEITNVDLIIRPYNWDINGKQGVTAYLSSAFITLREDELDLKYSNVPDSAQSSFQDEFSDMPF